MTHRTREYTIDPAHTIPLGNDWRAVVAIAHDGTESLWLASPAPDADAGCACAACASHEQLGPPVVSGPRKGHTRGTGAESRPA